VATLPSFAHGWLLPRLGRFKERYPRIDLYLKTERALVDFRHEDADLAIRFGPGARGSDLKSVLLLEEEACPVASPALVAATRLPLQVAELRDWPLLHDVDAHPHQRWMGWPAWFERAGVSATHLSRALTFSDASLLVAAAVAGYGVALGRSAHVESQLARGQLLRLTRESWKAEWAYRLVAPPANFARPNVRAFSDWILAEAAVIARESHSE
jgi:LysR family glycine cleavage system transcriptional activator